ncbi:MAG: pilus assembly protein PilM [Candidatus Kaiserbacteria bacterium]|nr:pilus assembly protein PilM [Candidatus Kaiserbacteria bacterium]
MKQRERNIVSMDVGNMHIKVLVGSYSEPVQLSKPFFELQGATVPMQGISRQGVVTHKKNLTHTMRRALDALSSFSGYDIDEMLLSYTHPDICFFKKTIGLQDIQSRSSVHITEQWLATQKEKIQERIHRTHRHKKCAYFAIVSLIADGEEILYDPYEFTATKSLHLTYVYLLAPGAFLGALLESAEHIAAIRMAQPAAIINGALLSDRQKEQGVVVCDIGTEFTNITIYQNGVPAGVRVLPFGGNTITNAIALLKKVSPEEAEQYKLALTTEDSPLKKQDVQRINKKITLTLKKCLLPYLKEIDAQKDFPGGVMLLGKGSLYPAMDVLVEKAIGLHSFYAKTPYHIQSQRHTHQTAWHTAYAALCGAVARQDHGSAVYYEKPSFLEKIMGVLHTALKILR